MDPSRMERAFRAADRPDVALFTNHGYAGANLPVGGAPDTGGQNVYVNSLAMALDRLGYRVTIFARGGFPFFGSDRIRSEPEYVTGHIRYIFVPGGGDRFVRKEDIAIVLDEQVEWLDGFIRREAGERGCEPWEVYGLINTHYWDAAVLGERLVERWRNDVAADEIAGLLDGAAPAEVVEEMRAERHWRALGSAPAHHLGRLLLNDQPDQASDLEDRLKKAARSWGARRGLEEQRMARIEDRLSNAVKGMGGTTAPALRAVVAADALGDAALEAVPETLERLRNRLEAVDTHVWTPHSLGDLKDENFRNRPLDVRRELKFCERRSHERMLCDRTRAFAATSQDIAERLRTHYGVPAEKIFYFPPCVDGRQFRSYDEAEMEPTYRWLSKASGFDLHRLKKAKIIFETSRMDRSKRKDLLLEAFERVLENHDDVYLFIGGGPRNDVFQSLRGRLKANPALKSRAFLTGFIPDEHIGPMFSVADVYVSPSEMEGFGMSVAHAAAATTAVVSSDLIPFSLHWVPEETLIVPAGDTEGFAEAMDRLLKYDDDRRERARGLSEKAKRLDWEAQTGSFLDYLRASGMNVPEGRRDS